MIDVGLVKQVNTYIRDNEEETRLAIKEEIKKRFDSAIDDVERSAILTAQQQLKEMSFEELQEQAELLGDEDF